MAVDPGEVAEGAENAGKVSQFGGDAEMNWKNVPCEIWCIN